MRSFESDRFPARHYCHAPDASAAPWQPFPALGRLKTAMKHWYKKGLKLAVTNVAEREVMQNL